jgi:predicted nucleotidyltransferase component of viral defense system
MNSSSGRGQSIIAKLTNLQRETGKSHQYLIDRFAQERFLYRLSTGIHRDRFVLKGGLLITALTDRFYRATHDIDVRAIAENDPSAVKAMMLEAIAHDVDDDGMMFDLQAMAIEPIKAQGDHRGLRLRIPARLGKSARAHIQMDMGFGDVVLLPYEEFEYPVLLTEYAVPVLRAYSVESVMAEKLEAIASLDQQSTRFKDYDDILSLAHQRRIHIAPLWHAITLTFERRSTALNQLMPALGADRAAKREREYQAYRKREHVEGGPETFAECLERLRHFVAMLQRYDADGVTRIWEDGKWNII